MLKMLYYLTKKSYFDINNQPVFLTGTNRSGASLLSFILRQHPELHTLNSEILNKPLKKNVKHQQGFGEDFIWQFLDDFKHDHFNGKKDGFLWGDPKHISSFFRDNFLFKKALIYEIYKNRINKIPFMKHSFFSLRLKLIKKIFPKARIIFNIRSYKDFIRSNLNKNFHDKRFGKIFKEEDPDIGLHWNIINNIALYQLEKYFKGQYIIFFHEKFYDKNFDNQFLMDEITHFLKLERFQFNFDLVNTDYKFSKKITYEYDTMFSPLEISKYEKKIYSKLKNKIHGISK